VLTIIDTSIGNYDFTWFDSVNDPTMQVVGKLLLVIVVIVFNLTLLNLIIAILANTYNMFDTSSAGLYLSKIVSTRDEL